ncbi:MAG: von Willebrand factor type A domain-containing protein [Acholeplasmatales bacterium]|nr:von Willebrand factor type A domain-containing protein [Acholeplasmatales bacterium]MDY4016680.1 von Willebrand factor type A domain-containing protein [Bacilli bacterium]
MKKILSAIAIMALMIVFASCTNSRKDGGASLYEPDNGMIEDGTSSQFDYEFVHNWGDQFLGENYNRIVENQYVYTNKQQESYFSMDSFTASYSNLRRYINYQTKIPNDAVRTDELLNYFNYDFGGPENDEMFSISANLGSTPWNERTQLLTINIKAKETDQGNYTGNNIVFLIDVSGSMASTNKLNLIKAVFPKFLDALAPTDKISIVTYSNKIKILANGVYADEKEALKKVVNGLSATGGTAGADGLEKAYNVAKSNYIAGGNNRVIIASDGDFNIGRYSQDDLKELVENQLNSGIYLTTLGFGMGNYKDTTMETLAKYGNGGYAYIDNLEEAEKVLVNDLNKTLYTVAKDVKSCVTFNPNVVKAYRLIGYENKQLTKDEFNDVNKDAGEICSGHNTIVCYEIELCEDTPNSDDADSDMFSVEIKYKDPKTDVSSVFSRSFKETDEKLAVTEEWYFASAIIEFSLLIRDSSYKFNASCKNILERLAVNCKNLLEKDQLKEEFYQLVKKAYQCNLITEPVSEDVLITIIYDAGIKYILCEKGMTINSSKILKYTFGKNNGLFDSTTNELIRYAVFADMACTEPLEEFTLVEDVTIFLKPIN